MKKVIVKYLMAVVITVIEVSIYTTILGFIGWLFKINVWQSILSFIFIAWQCFKSFTEAIKTIEKREVE